VETVRSCSGVLNHCVAMSREPYGRQIKIRRIHAPMHFAYRSAISRIFLFDITPVGNAGSSSFESRVRSTNLRSTFHTGPSM